MGSLLVMCPHFRGALLREGAIVVGWLAGLWMVGLLVGKSIHTPCSFLSCVHACCSGGVRGR